MRPIGIWWLDRSTSAPKMPPESHCFIDSSAAFMFGSVSGLLALMQRSAISAKIIPEVQVET